MTTEGRMPGDHVRIFVRSHHVQYHVWPEVWHVPEAVIQVGYRLELAADAPNAIEHSSPGGAGSQAVYDHLREVARAILPAQDAESRFEIEPFDAAWHGRSLPEVILTIAVLHQGNSTEAAGAAQRNSVADMKERLRALGAAETSGVAESRRTG